MMVKKDFKKTPHMMLEKLKEFKLFLKKFSTEMPWSDKFLQPSKVFEQLKAFRMKFYALKVFTVTKRSLQEIFY